MHQMTISKENPVAQVKTVLPSAGKDPQYLEIWGLYARSQRNLVAEPVSVQDHGLDSHSCTILLLILVP